MLGHGWASLSTGEVGVLPDGSDAAAAFTNRTGR